MRITRMYKERGEKVNGKKILIIILIIIGLVINYFLASFLSNLLWDKYMPKMQMCQGKFAN